MTKKNKIIQSEDEESPYQSEEEEGRETVKIKSKIIIK